MTIKIIQRSSDERYCIVRDEFLEDRKYRGYDDYWWSKKYMRDGRWYVSYDEALKVYNSIVHPPKPPVIIYTIVHPTPWWKKLLNSFKERFRLTQSER